MAKGEKQRLKRKKKQREAQEKGKHPNLVKSLVSRQMPYPWLDPMSVPHRSIQMYIPPTPEHKGPTEWPTQKEALDAIFQWVRDEGWEPRVEEDDSFYLELLEEEVEDGYPVTPVEELGDLPYNSIAVGMFCPHGIPGDSFSFRWDSKDQLWSYDDWDGRQEGERSCGCGI